MNLIGLCAATQYSARNAASSGSGTSEYRITQVYETGDRIAAEHITDKAVLCAEGGGDAVVLTEVRRARQTRSRRLKR